jgi:hypothetical protein
MVISQFALAMSASHIFDFASRRLQHNLIISSRDVLWFFKMNASKHSFSVLKVSFKVHSLNVKKRNI